MDRGNAGHSLAVAVMAGTCLTQGLANALGAIHAEGALVADVPSELSYIHPFANVLKIPLGENQTTATRCGPI